MNSDSYPLLNVVTSRFDFLRYWLVTMSAEIVDGISTSGVLGTNSFIFGIGS